MTFSFKKAVEGMRPILAGLGVAAALLASGILVFVGGTHSGFSEGAALLAGAAFVIVEALAIMFMLEGIEE